MSTASTEEGKLPNERAKMTECSGVELAMLKWTWDLHPPQSRYHGKFQFSWDYRLSARFARTQVWWGQEMVKREYLIDDSSRNPQVVFHISL